MPVGRRDARSALFTTRRRRDSPTEGDRSAGRSGDAAARFQLEVSLALAEFLELKTRPVLDLESAMPAIVAGLERTKG
jgi:hypothetical protein